MELEDFKQDWNATMKNSELNYNLNEILAQKVKGPLKDLKTKYGRQIILLPAAAILLTVTNLITPELRTNPIVWAPVFALCLLTFFYYRSYLVTKKMEQPFVENIKTNLENQLTILEKYGKEDVLYVRRIFIMFIIVLEVSMANNLIPAYDSWKHIDLFLRIGAYLLFLMAQPYITRYFYKQNLGQYINKLKDLINQSA
ncbi:hypothetical protein [Flavobacterium sp. '19STA2R22 D10 B1']|uniref:hypothetical protein n=1 Tax=Flavobacterium aerium TaxID=3037261 RepID=UPI00278C3325|nr:hypothetical protein [Flavobacterium sp. '19STA2R22 D10 B1']